MYRLQSYLGGETLNPLHGLFWNWSKYPHSLKTFRTPTHQFIIYNNSINTINKYNIILSSKRYIDAQHVEMCLCVFGGREREWVAYSLTTFFKLKRIENIIYLKVPSMKANLACIATQIGSHKLCRGN